MKQGHFQRPILCQPPQNAFSPTLFHTLHTHTLLQNIFTGAAVAGRVSCTRTNSSTPQNSEPDWLTSWRFLDGHFYTIHLKGRCSLGKLHLCEKNERWVQMSTKSCWLCWFTNLAFLWQTQKSSQIHFFPHKPEVSYILLRPYKYINFSKENTLPIWNILLCLFSAFPPPTSPRSKSQQGNFPLRTENHQSRKTQMWIHLSVARHSSPAVSLFLEDLHSPSIKEQTLECHKSRAC